MTRKGIKRTIFITLGILIAIPVLVIVFASPISKYLLEKYSVKWTGRQIRTEWIYINPFTGHVNFSKLKIYEANSDSIFLSAENLTVNIAVRKLFHKEYEITSVTLDRPKGYAIFVNGKQFNFHDVVEHFESHPPPAPPMPGDTVKHPLHLNILNINIVDGVFGLRDSVADINYFIKKANFNSHGKRWDNDTMDIKFSFVAGMGTGDVNAELKLNCHTLDYSYYLITHKLSMTIIQQYLNSIINYGTFTATIDADIKATGNFTDADSLDAKGRVVLNDFHFGKTPGDDYLSFDKFVLAVNRVNPEAKLYLLDSVTFTHPYFKFEQYDHLDNLENIFGRKGSNVVAAKDNDSQFNLLIVFARYIIALSHNFFKSDYVVNHAALYRGDLQFNDFTKGEEFSLSANPLTIIADSVNKNKGNVKIHIKTGVKPYGSATIYASINPRDSDSFDLDYTLNNVPVSVFNPYLISYTSFPFDRGTLHIDGKWMVRKGIIQSTNHLVVTDPQVGSRNKNTNNHWAPLGFLTDLVRDRHRMIDYYIPVTGNLKKPNYHLGSVVWGVIKNLLVKPPTLPFDEKAKEELKENDESLALEWEVNKTELQSKEEKFIKKVAKFLAKNPEASITVNPEEYEMREKEHIAFFEAKKMYYVSLHGGNSQSLTGKDTDNINKFSIKDSLFARYLDKHKKRRLIFTAQDKCIDLVGNTIVNARFNQLCQRRKDVFLSFFKERGLEARVKFRPSQNNIPYNGYSYYKLIYKGIQPDFIANAQ